MASSTEPIAIVGVGCRFPGGCDTPSKLWDLICDKRDVQSSIPKDRWNNDAIHHEDGERPGCSNVQHVYFLEEDVKTFDAGFFRMSRIEVEAMDPQQRMLLEMVYEAMESAGLKLEDLGDSDTAVYVGCMTHDYEQMLFRDVAECPKYAASGTARSILANRISYFYNWHGPSVTIDTACSSSLVAVHDAVQALRSGTSRLACAAGANLILGPEPMISESKLHMLSSTGRSRMWDADGEGYGRGEGCAALMLKTLSNALADGDEIYCIIRETGVNSDGRTNGITMPSAESQAELIRQTYARAGLDPVKDRCQYFEAHGTGTKAGDPQEARAIYNTFFPDGDRHDGKLYVGSVKTVIGHLEGTAGIAGLVKAAEAVRNGIVPPNMLLDRLNPEIEPYSAKLQVPTQSHEWPPIPIGAPRRVSVNSFGFGGTNAHAIIENFTTERVEITKRSPNDELMPTPLVLSANCESSLKAQIAALADVLETNEWIEMRDLLYTMQSRRSQHYVRASYWSDDKAGLIQQLKAAAQTNGNVGTQVLHTPTQPRLLGIFTGQGAQWAGMGVELVRHSPHARKILAGLDESLATLLDAPPWTLSEQLLAPASISRLGEAAVAQPLCTAVQIMLVDLLAQAGLNFSSVVGHSSGEIAAAYTAGVLTAQDAIRIAYYRGLHAPLAKSANGKKGAMMAIGLSYDEACDLCEGAYAGVVDVAAWNSDTSVTLSGDEDAINAIKLELDAKDVFARVLKVDTAYHSHHMLPCADPYAKSLQACSIKPRRPRNDCTWFSSVYGGRVEDEQSMACQYWVDNLLNPVLFRDTIETAANGDLLCDAAIEVGPHPTLKGPSTLTYQRTLGMQLRYYGTLSRGRNDVEALSETLGSLWSQLGAGAIDFIQYNHAFSTTKASPKFIRLPHYSWDHSKQYWKEGRKSTNYRTRDQTLHPLLGTRAVDDVDTDKRWENCLRLKDLTWLAGHVVQDQVVFPGAGYLVMALEASKSLAQSRHVRLHELLDVEIGNALILGESEPNVSTLFTLKTTSADESSTGIKAEWSCHSVAMGDSHTPWRLNARGHVRLVFKDDDDSPVLPSRSAPAQSLLTNVKPDEFFDAMSDLGIKYSGHFRRLDLLYRRLDFATAQMTGLDTSHIIHPAVLDSAFQSLFAALSYPGDGALTSTMVPTRIRSIRFVGSEQIASTDARFLVDCFITHKDARSCTGDIEMYNTSDGRPLVQLEGITCTHLTQPGPGDYRELYVQEVWELDIADGLAASQVDRTDDPRELALLEFEERLAYSSLRDFYKAVAGSDAASLGHFAKVREWLERLFPLIESGKHPTVKAEWVTDDLQALTNQATEYASEAEMQLFHAVSDNLIAAARQETTILEHMLKDNKLERSYCENVGMSYLNHTLGQVAHQIAHRYPRMNILEIGAGTGGATSGVLEGLGFTFDTYTYTDISSGFFEAAGERFEKWNHKLNFRTLNIEEDVNNQGYESHAYDMLVASNVLHATRDLHKTLDNVRQLLKPGGYLLLLEFTGQNLGRYLTFGSLPGWWLSEDGRQDGPTVNKTQWDQLLRETGFSGIDALTSDLIDPNRHMNSVLVTQAIDPEIQTLRTPLSCASQVLQRHEITIIGGRVAQLNTAIECILAGKGAKVALVPNLQAFADLESTPSTVLCLEDLDEAVLQDFTQAKIQGLQKILPNCREFLWVGDTSRFGRMSIGLFRTLANEYQHVTSQFLTVVSPNDFSMAPRIAETLIRLIYPATCANPEHWLWTEERELFLDQKGKTHIIRLLPDDRLNDRLNAGKLPIKHSVDLDSEPVTFEQHNGSCIIKKDTPLMLQGKSHEDEMHVTISHALSRPLQSSGTSLYLCYGHLHNDPVLLLSKTCSSSTYVPCDLMTRVARIHDPGAVLPRVAHSLIVEQVLENISARGNVAVNEPDTPFGTVLLSLARQRGIEITGFSSGEKSGCTHIHKLATERQRRHVLPVNVAAFLDLDQDKSQQWKRILPSGCNYLTLDDLWQQDLQLSKLSTIVNRCLKARGPESSIDNVVPVTSIVSGGKVDLDYSSVIDFTATAPIQAYARPSFEETNVRSDGTYFLVGCGGGLGRSMCSWLVSKGARYLALVSRNPTSIDPAWTSELEARGAMVNLCQADVTDLPALRVVLEQIERTMPPIVGVVNAAMVLSDKSFENCTVADFDTVFGPKVRGTEHLAQLFGARPLDFFVMFSSLAIIVGSKGQSNYASANLFMTSIAEERRAKGLCASVLHIGVVTGVGYVTRTGLFNKLMSNYEAPMPISEAMFLDMFAQAILVGRPDSGHSAEIIAGVARMDPRSEQRYSKNPKFSHHVMETSTAKTEPATAAVSVRQLLVSASDADEAAAIIQDAFRAKLEKTLQTPAESIDCAQPIMNLGVDSLIAVEIRSWFLTQTDVNLPVLKILGGASVADLCREAATKFAARRADEDDDPGNEPSRESSPGTRSDSTHTPPSSVDDAPGHESIEREGPLTPDQELMFDLLKTSGDPTLYNYVCVFKLHGILDLTRFEQAWHQVINRHQILRTRFVEDATTGTLRQCVLPSKPPPFTVEPTLSHQAAFTRLENHVFDLESGVVMAGIVMPQEGETLVALAWHHIAWDLVSTIPFLRDFNTVYLGATLPPLEYQFLDWAVKQRHPLPDDIAYWKTEYPNMPPALPLFPFAKTSSRPPFKLVKGKPSAQRILSAECSNAVKACAKELGATAFNVYFAACQVLLYRMLGANDTVIGVVTSNRDAESDDLIGLIRRLIPIRSHLQKEFAATVQTVSKTFPKALSHGRIQTKPLMEELPVPNKDAPGPFWQFSFNYVMKSLQKLTIGDLEAELVLDTRTGSEYCDFALGVQPLDDGTTSLLLRTRHDLYTAHHAAVLLVIYERFVSALVRDAGQDIDDVPILSVDDAEAVLNASLP